MINNIMVKLNNMKWTKELLLILDSDKYLSTTQVMLKLRKRSKINVNWTTVSATLKELESLEKVESLKIGKMIGWKKID